MSASPPLKRSSLDAQPFLQRQCETLFEAILVDDEVDEDLRQPDTIHLLHGQASLVSCFRLARQLWIEGFDRDLLVRLSRTMMRERDLDAADRLSLKHMRAKFKHLRYAHALYGARHRQPPMLDLISVVIGQAQDAYRVGDGAAVARWARLLRVLLARPIERWVRSESDRLVPTSSGDFRDLLVEDFRRLEALLAGPTTDGHTFHKVRRIVGRQVSFWDTLRTIAPTDDRFRMSRWLSAINGEMGDIHDRLVERRARDASSYGAQFFLPEPIRRRITVLVAVARDSPVD